MPNRTDILNLVRQSAAKRILYLPHAVRQMSRPDRMINMVEVRCVVEKGELIEDYPEDKRGHSCLMMSNTLKGRTVHVVCAPKEEYLAIITAYVPSTEKWEDNFKIRRNRL